MQLYTFGRRASLFGVNAPDPKLLAKVINNPPKGEWTFIHDSSHIDLDTTYTGLAPLAALPGDFATSPERFTWLVLSAGKERRLYQVLAAADRAPLRYTLSSKATGLKLDRDDYLRLFRRPHPPDDGVHRQRAAGHRAAATDRLVCRATEPGAKHAAADHRRRRDPGRRRACWRPGKPSPSPASARVCSLQPVSPPP